MVKSVIRKIVGFRLNVHHQLKTSDEAIARTCPCRSTGLYISQLGIARHSRGHEYRVGLRHATMRVRHSFNIAKYSEV